MFWRILKRDLKRKRTMNMILLLFILLASMFLASSANNLVTVTGTVDRFIEMSEVPDLFVLALAQGEEDPIRDFIEKNPGVKKYDVQDAFGIQNDQVEILYRKDEDMAEKDHYEKSNTLSIQAVPDNYMKVFDEDGKKLVLRRGEIALARLEAENNHLQKGDRIAITVGGIRKEFTVAALTKDAVFGTGFMGFKRNIISKEDFDDYASQDGVTITRIYNIDYADQAQFEKDYKAQKFNVISGVEKNLIPMCYVFDLLVAGVLVLVSICLILIAFLVLRFTISFTLQEDYKEIGIMKAIGLKDRDVGKIYLVKYLGIAIVGATIGLFCSIPFGKVMLKQAVVNIVVDSDGGGLLVNLLASVLVVLIVLLFCNRCIGKTKKISAIEAIRSGSSGERFVQKHMNLFRHKRISVPGFLAVNDVVNQKRRFVVLLLSFMLGTVMILLPLCAATTLKGEDIVYSFGVWKSDLYVESGTESRLLEQGEEGVREAQKYLDELKDTLAQENIGAETGMQIGFIFVGYAQDDEDTYACLAMQPIGEWEQHLTILDGREPVHENEIAITEVLAESMGVSIGDSIHLSYTDGDHEYLITGTYQTMMNMGEGIWLPKAAKPDGSYLAGVYAFQVALDDSEQRDAAIKALEKEFPQIKIYQGTEWLNDMCGLDSIIGQVTSVTVAITVVVLAISALLTILMVRTFLTKERGDIALMKSMGFRNFAIRRWQSVRILLVLVTAIVLGTILSRLIAPMTMGKIFAMMGARRMKLTVDPLLSYVIYPLLMIAVTGVAALLSTGGIRGIDVKEVNSIE